MQSLYIFRDMVSGQSGDVFQCANDAVMRRSCIRSLASVSPEIARDTVVLHVATIDFDQDNLPVIQPCSPRIALVGSAPEVAAARDELMSDARRYGGSADEE